MIDDDPLLNVAMEVPRTEAEGPGMRYAVWVQGCPMRCVGCCNPEMLAFRPVNERRASEVAQAAIDAGVDGVSFLGGEPFAQAAALGSVARRVRKAGLSVMVYSGYTLEELQTLVVDARKLLRHTDLLVDGRYDAALRTTERRFVGSINQRMHHLTDAYAPDDPRLQGANTIEIRLRAGELLLNGWPATGARTRLVEKRTPEPFSGRDGAVLAFVDALFHDRDWDVPVVPLEPSARVELLAEVSRRIARECARWLVEQGGRRRRTVLRDGERVRGRVWDAELQAPTGLRFGRATDRFWRQALKHLPGLRKQTGPRELRKRLRSWIAAADTEPGDWLLYTLAWRRLCTLPLSAAARERLEPRLSEGSPLFALFRLHPGHPTAPLLRPPMRRVMECTTDALTAAWRELFRANPTPAQAHTYAAQLGAWLDELDAAGRMDLATPVMRALSGLRTPASPTAETVAELGVLRARQARLYAVAARLTRIREALGAARYGDARYPEAQLYLDDYDRHFAEHAPRLASIERSLDGVVG